MLHRAALLGLQHNTSDDIYCVVDGVGLLTSNIHPFNLCLDKPNLISLLWEKDVNIANSVPYLTPDQWTLQSETAATGRTV